MSNTIIEKSTGKEIGPDKELRLREAAKPGYVPPPSKESYFRQLELVPVKIESLINRDTLDSNISKILKNGGGFKSDKWDPSLRRRSLQAHFSASIPRRRYDAS